MLIQRKPPPDYMKDNANNYFGTAPDRGSMTGPVLGSINSTDLPSNSSRLQSRSNTDDYWLSSMGGEGKVSFQTPGRGSYERLCLLTGFHEYLMLTASFNRCRTLLMTTSSLAT